MSRSDGTFPQYVKLDYSKSEAPENWNDGVRRCKECKKNWPNLPEFSPSPCCNCQAGTVSDALPDMDWETAYIELVRFRFDRVYEKWNDGATDIELAWSSIEPISDQEISEGLEELNSFLSSLEEEHTHDASSR